MKKLTGFKISHYTAKTIGISIFMVMLIVASVKTFATGEQYEYNLIWFVFSLAGAFFLAISSYLNPLNYGKGSSMPDVSENQVYSDRADYNNNEAEDDEEKKISSTEPESDKKMG